MIAMLLRWYLLILALSCAVQQSSTVCPDVIDNCVCNVRNSVELVVDCNGASISDVTEQLRAEGAAANVTELRFLGAGDAMLASNTFSQFVSLTVLDITFSPLSQIDPGVFNNLTGLQSLDLRNNNLMWLSAETFTGIGTSLETLHLDRNTLQYLRSDLEPFFSTIQTEITLSENVLDCDCNLQWLADFIGAHALPEVRDAECSNGLSITDPAVNFTMCQDPCVQGFHNCHDNATCSWNQSSGDVTCPCNSGFVGDGFTCEEICESNLNNCHPNATCQWNGSTADVICTCNPGFEGNGLICSVPTHQTSQTTLNNTQIYTAHEQTTAISQTKVHRTVSQPTHQTSQTTLNNTHIYTAHERTTATKVHRTVSQPRLPKTMISQATPHSTTPIHIAESTPARPSPETSKRDFTAAFITGAILGIWIILIAVIAGVMLGVFLYWRNKKLHHARIVPKSGESPPLIPMQFNEPEEEPDAVSESCTHL